MCLPLPSSSASFAFLALMKEVCPVFATVPKAGSGWEGHYRFIASEKRRRKVRVILYVCFLGCLLTSCFCWIFGLPAEAPRHLA